MRPPLQPLPPYEAFRLLGQERKKSRLTFFENSGNLAMVFRVRKTTSPQSMEAMWMVIDLLDSEQRCSVLFTAPPWNTESPEWLALDADLGLDHPVRQIAP